MKKFLAAVLAVTLCFGAVTGCKSKVEKNLKLGTYETDVENPVAEMPSIVLKENNQFDIVYKGKSYMDIEGTYEINDNDEVVFSAQSEDGDLTYVFDVTDDYNLVLMGISSPLPTTLHTEFVPSYVSSNQEFDYADDYYSEDDE